MPGKKDPEIYEILRDTLTRMEEGAIKYKARRIKKLWDFDYWGCLPV